jgi:hypothetical protein
MVILRVSSPNEESSLLAELLCRHRKLACRDLLSAVAPRLRRSGHGAQSAQDVENGLAQNCLRKQRHEGLLDLRSEFMEKNLP